MLNFVGSGGALYPKLYNCNAWFKIGRDLFLLDCGETSFRRHYMAGHFQNIDSLTVLLTHMHADHIGSLGTLVVYAYLYLGLKTKIIFPDAENLRTVLTLTGVEPQHYDLFTEYSQCGDPRLEAIPIRVVHHDILVKSFGYLLAFGGKRIYYSGDAGELPGKIREMLLRGELDELYQDTSLKEHGGAHFTLAKLEQAIPPEYRSRVYCMHYDGEFFDLIRQKGFQTIEKAVENGIK